jgi:hypothetical protein
MQQPSSRRSLQERSERTPQTARSGYEVSAASVSGLVLAYP